MSGQDGKIWYGLGIDNTQLQADANKSSRIFKGIGDTAVSEGVRIDNTYKKVAGSIAAFFTIQQAVNFAKQIAVVRGEFQQLDVAFTTLLQSKSKADVLMSQMVDLAAKTPFKLTDVATGAKQLIAYGFAADDITETLTRLGNIASGLGLPMERLTYLYGTTMTQGRLYARDLMQFTTSGIPMLQGLADLYGKSTDEINNMVTAGKIGFPEVQKVVESLTNEGGKFYNLMEEQSKTIGGKISNLGDAIDVMFNKIGQSQEGVINDILDSTKYLIENYEAVGREIWALIVAYGAYKAAVIATAAIQQSITKVRYSDEASELLKLLSIEQQAKISKLGLAKTSIEHSRAVKAEVVAEMERQTQIAITANAEVSTARARLALMEQEKIASTNKVAAKKIELEAIISSATAEQTASLQKKMVIESEKQSRIALEVVKLQGRKNDAIDQARHLNEIGASSEKIAAKNREIAVIAEKIAVQRAEEVQHSRNVVALRAEIAATATSVESKAILKAQSALQTAQTQLETVATARNAAALELSSQRAIVDSAVRKANTIETGINTAIKNANTKSSTALFFANFKLSAITSKLSIATKKLNAAIMANPYVVAAVAIAALAYGIYRLVTAQTAAEKAQENFNEKIEDGKKKQDEFINKTNELIGVIRTETNTRYMQTKAFKELNDKYPELLKNISMENLLLMDNLELQKLISQYTENESKKELFTGLDGATKDLATAKQALDNYVSNSSQGTGGTSILEVWRLNGNIEEAEESLKLWQDKLKEHRQIEADARPVDVKIADLSKNITLLETQLAEIQRLQEEAKKNSPFSWNLYDLQVGAINAQISAKQGELKTLKAGNDAQKEQDKNKAYWETQKQNAQDALEAMGEAKKNTKEWNTEIAKMNQANEKLKQWNFSSNTDKNGDDLKKLNQEIISNQLKLEDEKTAILEDGRKKRLALSEQELVEKKAVLKKEYDETVAEYKKLGKALPKEVTTTYNQRIEVADTAKTTRDTEINKDVDNDFAEHQRAITDVFLNEESKRLEAIKERYDKEREWADAQFKGGNMTVEQRDNYKSDVDKSQQHEELESLLKEYQTYADKRKEIEDKFNSEIATMRSKNEGRKYDAQIKQAEKQKNEVLADLDTSISGSTGLWSSLFENFAYKSKKDLTEIAENARNVLEYVNNTPIDKIEGKFGMSAEQLKALKNDVTGFASAYERLNEIESSANSKNPFLALIKGAENYKKSLARVDAAKKALENTKKNPKASNKEIKDAEEAVKKAEEASVKIKANLKEAVANIGQEMSQIGDAFQQAGESLGNDTLADVGQALSLIGDTASKLASGDYLGAALGLFTAWAEAEGRHRKALEEVMNSKIAQQREYNLLLLEQNLLYEQGTTIFGTDEYGKAINAVKNYKDALSQLGKAMEGTDEQKNSQKKKNYFLSRFFGVNDPKAAIKEQYAGLADMQIVTGHKKTGLFGWGKGKDTYSSILSVYPELIDSQGKFDAKLAETIISTRKMDDTTKTALQNCIDLSNQYEDAMQQVKDYLTDIFGELGGTMSDALADAFKNGTDAAEAFADSVSDMLENLAKQMVYSVTIAPLMEKAQKKMLAVMDDDTLTEEEKFKRQAEILSGLTKEAITQQGKANELYKIAQDTAAGQGIDIFQPDEKEREASQKGFASMSQDSADELNGRFTAIQGHTYLIQGHTASMADNMKILADRSSQILTHLSGIESNTAYCSKLETIDKNMISMKNSLDEIQTKGLVLRK